MAQSVAVVRGTLSATLSGTTDFTSTGFGTPTGAIVIFSAANSTNNPQDDAELSVGFWDGTSQRSILSFEDDNLGTSSATRYSEDSYIGYLHGTYAYTCSAVTDGIRLTLSVDGTTLERHATVILLAGVSAKALTFTANATQNSATASASLGFAPKLAFFLSIGASTADIAGSVHAVWSLGVCDESLNQFMIGRGGETGVGTTAATMKFSTNRVGGQIFSGAVSWSGEVTAMGADTFTVTTRDGGSGSDVMLVLAIGGADVSCKIGELTTATATGNSDVTTTGIDPSAALVAVCTASTTTINTTNETEGISLGIASGSANYSHAVVSEYNADTSNCISYSSTTKVIDLYDSAGGTASQVAAASATMGTEKFTLNYTTAPGTARKGFFVAFGPATGGAADPEGSLIHGKLLNGLLNRGVLVG